MICSNCGTENTVGAKFCSECATRLAVACPACGTVNGATAKFCSECATPLTGSSGPGAGAASAGASRGAPAGLSPAVAERRLVSVLFADLVGFTPFAEERDAEEVRETLERLLRPGARRHRALRRHGREVHRRRGHGRLGRARRPRGRRRAGRPRRARAGRRGPGARTRHPGAGRRADRRGGGDPRRDEPGHGRRRPRQHRSPPAVGGAGRDRPRRRGDACARPRRPSPSKPAGEQLLKGKAAPVPAWRALRVVAQRGGHGRSDMPEPPFVGRDEELRLLKDAAPRRRPRRRAPRLVSITGPGGIGKSRLAWELEKYIDGVVETIYWHRGRSPAYGEGVTFWALGEMVRRRAGLAEDRRRGHDPRSASPRPSAEYVPDADERRWVEPALLTLLGLEPPPPAARGAVRRLAHLLRAHRRARHDRPPVRGSPVGRQRACSTSSTTCSSGRRACRCSWSPWPGRSCSTGGRTGAPGTRSLHRDRPRAAVRRGDARAAGGLRARPARSRPSQAIVGRADGIPLYAVETVRDARRRRPRSSAVDGTLPADRRARRAGRSGDAALADRVAPRRPRAGRSAPPPGRVGARPASSPLAALAAV